MLSLDTIYVHMTTHCNLKCYFCAVANLNEHVELPKDDIIHTVSQGMELGTTYVVLIGGEPFTRSDVGDIATEIISKNIRVGFATNGTLLTEKTLEWAAKVPKTMFYLGVSLDGASPQTHDRIRGVRGAYDLTLAGIRLAHDMGIRLVLQTVMHRANASEIPEIARLAASVDADYSVIPEITPKGAGKAASAANLSITEILSEAGKLYKVSDSLGIRASIGLPAALLPLERFHKPAMACFWATHFCGVMPNGDITMCHGCDFCDMTSSNMFVAGNIRSQSLEQIWNESDCFKALRAIDPDDFHGVCGRCVIRQYCRGYCRLHAYLKYESILGPDPICQAAFENGLFPKYMLEE